MGFFNKKQEVKFDSKTAIVEIVARMDLIEHKLRELDRIKGIPEADLKICEKIKRKFPNLDLNLIHSVILEYQEILKDLQKAPSVKILDLMRDRKEQAEKVFNCDKCKKPLKEGEFYFDGDKKLCLSHLEEKKLKGSVVL